MARYRLIDGVRVEIVGEKLAELEAEEKANIAEQEARQAERQLRRNKIEAYRAKGWVKDNEFDALSFFEDMSERTSLIVLGELKSINDGL